MEIQFQYITKLAAEYKLFTGNSSELFRAINQLSEPSFQDIYNEYNEAKFGFQPVNLLRAEIARQLLDGKEVSEESVEQIKNHIRQKDTNYFSHLPAEFLRELEDYRVGKRDMFANWQKSWNIFHVFLYRGKVRETVQLYLEQLCRQLATDLQLVDYASIRLISTALQISEATFAGSRSTRERGLHTRKRINFICVLIRRPKLENAPAGTSKTRSRI